MKSFSLYILMLSITASAAAQPLQPKKVEFKGTGLSITLPDTSFVLKDDDEGPQYSSRPFRAFIGLAEKSVPEELHSFDDAVRLWREEMGRPGSRLAIDTSVTAGGLGARIFKTEIRDKQSGTVRDIFWSSIYNFKGKPLMIMGAYAAEHDALMSPAYLRAFLSVTTTNADSVNAIFKLHFSITNDYLPLKFGGYMLGGYALSETGKYPKDGELQCIIVPYNSLEVKDTEILVDLLTKRLFLHEKRGESLIKYSTSSTTTQGLKTYRYAQDVLDVKYEKKIVFLAIKTDQYGYFEVWGEAYGDNREEYITLFRKIAESIRRDGDQ